ncbi:unnamed protein product [Medioppia subpectinata]|uniref:Uncharacterized protein n=1 Tax=Medioppia subpectinata TaxID=1979941 RepID=A0A7R9PZY7_9ACAR|nr:unnamed protein product [Medioppia subpectinata]CAG2107565.1 unnamed protein product [Medioppia subpectinata]
MLANIAITNSIELSAKVRIISDLLIPFSNKAIANALDFVINSFTVNFVSELASISIIII